DRTNYEWLILQDRWLKGQPLFEAPGGEYSHFQKFYVHHDKWPEYLPLRSGAVTDKPLDGIDIKRIVGDSLCFRSPCDCLGLQAAHICVNAFRRAVMGNLLWPSWLRLGRLMLAVRGRAIDFHFVTENSPENLPKVPEE